MDEKEFEKKIKEAKEELAKKSYRDIQIETAYKWAARACASYVNLLKAKKSSKFQLYCLAQEYEHEAIEHAALVDGSSNTLKTVQEYIAKHEIKAYNNITKELGID